MVISQIHPPNAVGVCSSALLYLVVPQGSILLQSDFKRKRYVPAAKSAGNVQDGTPETVAFPLFETVSPNMFFQL